MFVRLEARRYKCLRWVSVELRPFNILIGPNASGKSTFLDVFRFFQDALEENVEAAVQRRSETLRDLVWNREGVEQGFELALEAELPERLQSNGYDLVRYEIGVALDEGGEGIVVRRENLWLISDRDRSPRISPPQRSLFPQEFNDRPLVHPGRRKSPRGYRLVVRKVGPAGNDYFRSERTDWNILFRLSPKRLALSGVPEDANRFPVALWFREVLRKGIQGLHLNSSAMRRPCPAEAPTTFQADGSNLPAVVQLLQQREPQRFRWWVQHLRTVLQDLETVEVWERPEDRSRYLVVGYRTGLKVPSWGLSDGTLRFLALTLIAYLPAENRTFLIEEPENGMHPLAIDGVFQSLRSVYEGQVFLATHSPLFMAQAEPEDLLIFGRTETGATDVVRGTGHPALQDWKRGMQLDTLFAAGVLG